MMDGGECVALAISSIRLALADPPGHARSAPRFATPLRSVGHA
jgi:hypothetical protein